MSVLPRRAGFKNIGGSAPRLGVRELTEGQSHFLTSGGKADSRFPYGTSVHVTKHNEAKLQIEDREMNSELITSRS